MIVAELNCVGFEHAEVNAALLAALRLAAPGEGLTFFAEAEHGSEVAKILRGHSINEIKVERLDVPNRRASNSRRFIRDLFLVWQLFRLADERRSGQIVFSSIVSSNLMAAKILARWFKVKVFVVPHDVLATVNDFPRRWYLIAPLLFWFRFALTWGSSRATYLVLGRPLKDRLLKEIPALTGRVAAIDLPYFFREPETFTPFKDGRIRFGSLGVGNSEKGTAEYFKLAGEVQADLPGAVEFSLVGKLVERKIMKLEHRVKVLQPLDRAAFERAAAALDYAVFLYRPASYNWRASGALFDAFSFLKPVIALRNDYFAYYFKEFGDIGYLCDSYEELKAVVEKIIKEKPLAKYLGQRQNLLDGRKKLDLPRIAEQFNAALGSK